MVAIRRYFPRDLAIAIIALGPLVGAAPAVAAVRLCQSPVTSGVFAGQDETAARKLALDDWKAKASGFGDGFASWRLAAGKVLECVPGKNGGFECMAHGAPCTIEQAPARRELRAKRIDT